MHACAVRIGDISLSVQQAHHFNLSTVQFHSQTDCKYCMLILPMKHAVPKHNTHSPRPYQRQKTVSVPIGRLCDPWDNFTCGLCETTNKVYFLSQVRLLSSEDGEHRELFRRNVSTTHLLGLSGDDGELPPAQRLQGHIVAFEQVSGGLGIQAVGVELARPSRCAAVLQGFFHQIAFLCIPAAVYVHAVQCDKQPAGWQICILNACELENCLGKHFSNPPKR